MNDSQNRMIKVLQFSISSAQGGITQYLMNIWRRIDRTRIHFDFLTFSKSIDFAEELIQAGCKVHQILVYPEQDMEKFMQVFGEVLDCGYDMIELHTDYWEGTIVEQMARERGIKIILHAHCSSLPLSEDSEEYERELATHYEIRSQIDGDFANAFWACSENAAEWLYGDSVPKDKVKIIQNAIDTDLFSYHPDVREKIREDLDLQDRFVVGYVGRLEPEKNPGYLLDIAANVKQELPQVVLLVVGDGDMRKQLEEQARDMGLEEHVVFMGLQKRTDLYYQAMDALVLPSFTEASPIVLFEAQCSALPCICSTNVSEDTNITGGVRYISLEAVDKWTEALVKISQGTARKSKGEILKSKGYDSESQIKQIEDLYIMAKLS